jgi:hypothetical protein
MAEEEQQKSYMLICHTEVLLLVWLILNVKVCAGYISPVK